MEGTKIELKQRKELPRNPNPENRKECCMGNPHCISKVFHSYTFRFDKPCKRFNTEKEPCLAITQLELPNGALFNTGSSMERWAKKRPRLKSAYNPKPKDNEDTNNDALEENNCDFNDEECYWEENNNEDIDDNEIDDNVEKLIRESANHVDNNDNEDLLKRKHTLSKHKVCKKKKCGKKLRFSLSKPPSPETIQVIRVDVTSNYSFNEEEQSSDDEDYGQRFQDMLDEKEGNSEEEKDFTIMCKKLTLTPRE